jgi:hypothetical protein
MIHGNKYFPQCHSLPVFKPCYCTTFLFTSLSPILHSLGRCVKETIFSAYCSVSILMFKWFENLLYYFRFLFWKENSFEMGCLKQSLFLNSSRWTAIHPVQIRGCRRELALCPGRELNIQNLQLWFKYNIHF